MSDNHIQEHETQEPIVVLEESTIVQEEPVLLESEQEGQLKTTVITTQEPVAAKPSRLSAAFKTISSGC
ncbi:hypothetical protein BGZ76_005692, partial [Entomortierella beljakovae]